MSSEKSKNNYLVVQEALQKNFDSIQFQRDVRVMISERASAELKYVKSLQKWIDKHSELFRQSNLYDNPIRNVLTKALEEATSLAALHQKQYNCIMEDTGPYDQLLNDQRLLSNAGNEMGDFDTMQKQYQDILKQRTSLEERLLKLEQSYSHSADVLCETERQVQESKFSRQLSPRTLKRQEKLKLKEPVVKARVEGDYKRYQRAADELEQYNSKQGEYLKKMATELQKCETERFRHIVMQMIEYSRCLQTIEEEMNRRDHKLILFDFENIAEQIDVDSIFKNVCRRGEGDTTSTNKVSFHNDKVNSEYEDDNGPRPPRSVNPFSNRTDEWSERHHRLAWIMHDIELSPEKATGTYDDSPRQKIWSTSLLESPIGVHDKTNNIGATTDKFQFEGQETFSSNSHESPITNIYSKSNGDMKIARTPSNSSDSAIEEIEIHDDTRIRRGRARPFPTRVFCEGGSGLSVEESVSGDHPNTTRDTPQAALHSTDVSRLKNVKVVALSDHQTTKPEHLQLKQGQMVMQIAGGNREGLAYGWSKSKRFGNKKYGFYPSNIVCLYQE